MKINSWPAVTAKVTLGAGHEFGCKDVQVCVQTDRESLDYP